jgi:hypothetical protein
VVQHIVLECRVLELFCVGWLHGNYEYRARSPVKGLKESR